MKIRSRKIHKHHMLIGQAMLFAMLMAMAGSALAFPDGTTPVWKLELVVKVADLSNAGTDDFVSVSLNNNNLTWMNYARDDFERNATFTYNLRLDGVTRLSDITQILIKKGGNDRLCIDSIYLGVNGNTFYAESLNHRWFDSGTPDTRAYLVDVYKLWTNPYCATYGSPAPPSAISRAQLEHSIEGLIGHLTGPDQFLSAYNWWYGFNNGIYERSVQVSKKYNTPNVIHVKLRMEKPIENRFNGRLYIEFDLTARMLQNGLYFTVSNLTCTYNESWVNDVIDFGTEFNPSGGFSQAIRFKEILKGRLTVNPLRFFKGNGQWPLR